METERKYIRKDERKLELERVRLRKKIFKLNYIYINNIESSCIIFFHYIYIFFKNKFKKIIFSFWNDDTYHKK